MKNIKIIAGKPVKRLMTICIIDLLLILVLIKIYGISNDFSLINVTYIILFNVAILSVGSAVFVGNDEYIQIDKFNKNISGAGIPDEPNGDGFFLSKRYFTIKFSDIKVISMKETIKIIEITTNNDKKRVLYFKRFSNAQYKTICEELKKLI